MYRLYYLAQGTNLDLGRLRFQQQAGGLANQVVFFALMGIVLVAIGIAVFFYLRRRGRLRVLAAEREEARLRLLFGELNLGERERRLLELLVDSDAPGDLLPVLESRTEFETAVRDFRTRAPGHNAIRYVPALRQRLEYGFNNIRNPFVDTRMLAPGTRLRGRIRVRDRDVNFLTVILALGEEQFVVRPPYARGRPVSLGRLRRIAFRVSRDNDAEYEFICRVLGQTDTELRAVRLGHSRDINRLLFRHADRIPLDLETPFFVIRQQHAGDRVAGFRAQDSQYTFNGRVKDLSIGGAQLWSDVPEHHVQEGDMVLFKLPGAQIRDDLAGMVVGALDRGDGHTQIHLQFMGMRELNRLKLSKYLASLKDEAPTAGSASAE